MGGYWELTLSRWSYPAMDGRREAWLGQLGVVPTFRYRPGGGASRWFVEAGVGATLTTTIYQTQRKRFSTSFNFADHVGVGRSLGASGEKEISLRFRHFSNAGIKHPNPGVNFVEVRYSFRFQ
jgi:lipid A 3-O-deacylase